MLINLPRWEFIFESHIRTMNITDPAHDLLHFRRVVALAKILCEQEQAQAEIVIPAAWLHDFIIIPKDSPDRKIASKLAAKAATNFLNHHEYPPQFIPDIAHAIEAHSFSAKIIPLTIEAKVVQDADRLDALGAIGIARCFALAGVMGRPFYDAQDPFCKSHQPDDTRHTLDHFYAKLLNLVDSLQTKSGQQEGAKRTDFMKTYLQQLSSELLN
jgi:uncharacterized protein